MIHFDEQGIIAFEQALAARYPREMVAEWVDKQSLPLKEMLTYYRCAMMEVETKFKVLNEKLPLGNDSNPIESIKCRLKSPRSIIEKMIRYDFPLTAESMETNMHDIAGVRVVCSTVDDIYMLSDAFLRQDDVVLEEKKDYFVSPKPNGYRSLHLIIATPIFLHDEKRVMKVEVQLRTLAMDVWASLEHKMRYKKSLHANQQIGPGPGYGYNPAMPVIRVGFQH